jgi:tripartite-type tricarboxylate transporter receptor subunit TctC
MGRRAAVLLCLVVAPVASIGGIACAQAADFYSGKTLTIVAGSVPGGGIDTVGRLVARYIGGYIAGKPNVIVQNMPGAGSLTSVRYLAANAPKDGTVMTTFNAGLVTQSIVEPDRIGVDFTKIGWIGVVSPEYPVCYSYGPSGVRTWDEMMRREQFALGSSGLGAGNYLIAATLREVFNAPVKLIMGFGGDAQRRLAIQRGELDGDCSSIGSIPKDWLRDGDAHIFVSFTEQRLPEIPNDVPDVVSLANSPEQKKLLELLTVGDALGRPFIMSQQVLPERLAEIRKAFAATMDDAEFRAEMARLQVPVHALTGSAVQDFIAKLSAYPADILAQAKRVYE